MEMTYQEFSQFLNGAVPDVQTEATEADVVETPAEAEEVNAQVDEATDAAEVGNTPEIAEATQADKDANAFAQMRTQNKLMSDMLAKMADAYGIKYENTEDMMNKLNEDALGKIAEKKGIPVELLSRLEMLEKNNAAYQIQQNQARLKNEFAAVQQKFGLTQDELVSFANTLDAEHLDLSKLNVEKEYVARNYDYIMEKRVQAAVQAALSKDAQVAAQSTGTAAPGTNTTSSNGEQNIKTVADFKSFLSGMQ